MALGLRMGKSPKELREEFSRAELAEYVVMMIGPEKFDGRTPLEKALDRMAGGG